jgi:hypothetical protein
VSGNECIAFFGGILYEFFPDVDEPLAEMSGKAKFIHRIANHMVLKYGLRQGSVLRMLIDARGGDQSLAQLAMEYFTGTQAVHCVFGIIGSIREYGKPHLRAMAEFTTRKVVATLPPLKKINGFF